MNFLEKIREKIFKVLKINYLPKKGFIINRLLTHDENCAKNRVWYNGDSFEIEQFFKQIKNTNHSFWGAAMTKGMEIRKIHVGFPKLLVDTLNNVCISDFNGMKSENAFTQELWDEIAKENDFKKILKKATEEVLKVGDGAFKISFDEKISKMPIIEFYQSEDVEFIRNRGRIREIKFYTRYNTKNKNYILVETYGYGYINYNLYQDDKEIDLNELDITEDLQNVVFDEKLILAVPYMIWESDKYKGRGESIFDNKNDCFDAIDEIVSQWQDAIRSGRVQTYIPQSLIPRDFETGAIMQSNCFDNRFITTQDDNRENASNEIKVVQPDIKTAAYLETYIAQLDMCLQGLISPSTIGVDVKKTDNAEAQREKEKVTLYTRQTVLEILEQVLEKLGNIAINAYNIQYNNEIEDIDLKADFGEYANPSDESVLELLSNPDAPMSIETKIDQYWGDKKTDKWKEEEAARIKSERGIIQMDEPTFTNDNLEDLDNLDN